MKIKRFALPLLLLGTMALGTTAAQAGANEDAVLKILNDYRPGSTGYGEMKVDKVTIDNAKKTITVACNGNTAYLPLTADRLASLKAEVVKALGDKYAKYKVDITARTGKESTVSLDKLVLFAPKKLHGPKEKVAFITDHEAQPAPKGLDGANIALWQSHGWYFEPKLNRWEWQRARIFETVEDLYTQSYVMPFLMPMLENAGAYVMSPRERDTNLTEIIIDRDNAATAGYSEKNGANHWKEAPGTGFMWDGKQLVNGSHPFQEGKARVAKSVRPDSRTEPSKAMWEAEFPEDGQYAVYVSYTTTPNSAPDAQYTINTSNGPRHFTVNQQMGGGTWIYLGHFPFKAGKHTAVELSNYSKKAGSDISADAVKIGGGMGVVSRIVKEPLDSIDYQYVPSRYPKFVEGARYFLQFAGAPDSVFTPSDYVNDYTDDYRSRGLWVNWLAGGSSQLPEQEGLKIPVDLSFAFHSDAGTFTNDSIVGTLGIYSTANGKLGNGDDASASRDLTDLVMTNIVNDVRAQFEPNWTRRGMWDQSYFEARVPQVPAMLLELLSHQNFADMKYGLDPNFRFAVSRAIYKGMLQFLAHRDGREYVVQPLPVNNFAITPRGSQSYTLSWAETVDSLEATAHPTYYIIEERIGDALGFTTLTTTTQTEFTLDVSDTAIHSYRIIAANDGGISFPSEVLALCDLNNGSEPVLVVNGFTRTGVPDWFEFGEEAGGFIDEKDHGVPYMQDISYIGAQFEFRRDIPWMDDDAAGFGASRSNYEEKIIAGNTFDYPYIHGKAIVEAGHSFYSTSVGAYQASPVSGNDAKIVDLILGKQKEIKRGRGVYGTYYKTFPTALQDKLAAATKAGASVFVSGSYVATDLWDNPNSNEATAEADKKFATAVLGYHWRVGQASVTGEAYEVDCRFREFNGGEFSFYNELNEDMYAVDSPDSFYAADKATGCTIMRYSENNLVAGTACAFPQYRTVVIGFPFETIRTDEARNRLMGQVLKFFTDKK